MGTKMFDDGARVCFVGDSITAAGGFIGKAFDFYNTYYPEKNVRMYNCGVPGDSAFGCVKRLDDIYSYNPTEIVLMFGMNDCDRRHFSLADKEERENCTETERKLHRESMYTLCDSFTKHGLPITLCSATAYDEVSDLTGENHIGVNNELRFYFNSYSEWLSDFSFKNIIDLNTPMTEQFVKLKAMGKRTVVRDDRVHPLPIAHDMMAAIILRSQRFDGVKEPTAKSLSEGINVLADFTEINMRRMAIENDIVTTRFVDWNMQWGQEKLTDAERAEYWKTRLDIAEKQGDYQLNCVKRYIELKPHLAKIIDEYKSLTEKMVVG